MNEYKDKCVDIKQYASTLINKLKDVDINNVGTAYENMLSRNAIEKLKELAKLANDKINAFYAPANDSSLFPYLVETRGDYGVWLRTDRKLPLNGNDILVEPGTILTAVGKAHSDGVDWLGVKYDKCLNGDQVYWVNEKDTFYSFRNSVPYAAPNATSSNTDWDIIAEMSFASDEYQAVKIKQTFNIKRVPVFDTPLEGHALIDIIEPQKETGTILLSNHTFFNNESIPSESGMNFVAKTENGFSFKAIKYGPKKYGYVKSDYINYDVWEKQ